MTSIDLASTDILGYGPIGDDLDAGRLGLVWGTAVAFADPPAKVTATSPEAARSMSVADGRDGSSGEGRGRCRDFVPVLRARSRRGAGLRRPDKAQREGRHSDQFVGGDGRATRARRIRALPRRPVDAVASRSTNSARLAFRRTCVCFCLANPSAGCTRRRRSSTERRSTSVR